MDVTVRNVESIGTAQGDAMDSVRPHDGTTIACDRWGAGPALILGGGVFQQRAIAPRTAHLADRLAPHCTVADDDRRGRGDSGDTPPYALDGPAALIEEFLTR